MPTELHPMPSGSLNTWIEGARRDYEQSRVTSGESPGVAAEKARASTEASFPNGKPAPGQLIFDVVDVDAGSAIVGYLWISRLEGDGDAWWVSDINIYEGHRGKGYGRAAMQLAEAAAAEHGARTLGLNVFGHNSVARGLYESLQYETTAVQMRKCVGPR